MRRLAVPLLAAAALFAGGAHADESFDAFRNFCVAGRAAAAPALALADKAGWQTLPPQFASQMAQFQGVDGRAHQGAGGTQVLITGSVAQTGIGPMRICAIAVLAAGGSDLASQLQAFAAVPKQTAAELPEGLYAWRDAGGAHVPVDRNAADFKTQFASGGVMIASTTTTPQMTMIQLMAAQ